MTRVVVDTDVLFAAFDSATGASRAVLEAILAGRVELLVSTALLIEYDAVLTRPENLERFGLARDVMDDALTELAELATPVAFHMRWRPAAADPDDDLVIETAVNGGAQVIVSFNIKDLGAAAERFGIAVSRPGPLLRRIR